MAENEFIRGLSPGMKKAICWIGETVREFPDKSRDDILKEAELRFDLNPRECEFISTNFSKLPGTPCEE